MLHTFMGDILNKIQSDGVTDICINRPGELWTESKVWQRHDMPDLTYDRCYTLATLIAAHNGKTINQANPIMLANLPTGERIQVVIPPACEEETVSITIRRALPVDYTLEQLASTGCFDRVESVNRELRPFENRLLKLRHEKRTMEFLDLAVKSKRNILIVGETKSGKTTLAKALIGQIPPDERIITMEQSHEFQKIAPPNRVHLFYNRKTLFADELLDASLNMNPKRIINGELKDNEAWPYLRSLNTGHPGSVSTLHADGAFEAFAQLASLVTASEAGKTMNFHTIEQRLFATLDIVAYMHKWQVREIYYDPVLKRDHSQQRTNAHGAIK